MTLHTPRWVGEIETQRQKLAAKCRALEAEVARLKPFESEAVRGRVEIAMLHEHVGRLKGEGRVFAPELPAPFTESAMSVPQ